MNLKDSFSHKLQKLIKIIHYQDKLYYKNNNIPFYEAEYDKV